MPTTMKTESSAPLYPMRLYLYDASGRYGEPVVINSEAHLHSAGTKALVQVAMREGREVRITDPGDLLLFHAQGGKVLWDGKNHSE